MESDKIKSITPREHILLRPTMYLGGMNPAEIDSWILNEDGTISFKKVIFTEGLLKIVNEAIDNSFDEYVKTNGEFSTKIAVTITKDTCTVSDNGRGISTEKEKDTLDHAPVCVSAVTVPMTGSNFDDDIARKSIGMNGLGVKGSNIFSKAFECITCDGKNTVKITCKDNLSESKYKITKPGKRGTTVAFTPDFEKFGVKEFDENLIALVKTRLRFLSWFFPKCTITFNGERIGLRAKDIATMFPQPSVVLNEPNCYICVYPSDEPYVLSYVNGISLREGGTHVDYVSAKIINDIREKVSKKYKEIKPADIRNRIGIIVFLKDFTNCKFNSQTKEKITNSQGEITEFLRSNNIDLNAFTDKILRTKPILENITDLFKLKEELAARKATDALNKAKKEVISEKYFAPVAKSGQKYLMITEGKSAFSGISPILGRKGIGYYMLMGKLLNIQDVSPVKKGKVKGFMENQEIRELVNILGLDLYGKTEDMTYDYVVVLSDADPDGTAIAGLILTMFAKLAPKMIEAGRICRLNTPLLIGLKGEKVEEYYFSFPDKKDMKKNLDYFYLKGLGSWTKSRLNQVLEKEGGMEKLLMPYDADKDYKQSIQTWFGADTEGRKNFLRGREFHINNT